MKYFSMFSGIGGFEYGLEKSEHHFECIGYSEVDKYAESIYKRKFPNHIGYGDATKIRTEELPDFEFLVGGFPCQAFSIAGKRRGFDDTRGTLFFEIARILRDKAPRYFLLENVKGLLSHDKGKTFQTILGVLSEMGYGVEWEVLNSKNFGVPQNRERVFLKGYSGRECGGEILYQKRENGKIINEMKLNQLNNNKSRSQGQRIYDPDGLSCCLIANSGGGGAKTGLYKVNDKCIPVLAPDRLNTRQNGRRMKEDGEPSFCLTVTDRHGVYDGYRVRKLTPRECERLQGFPDDWTKYGVDGELISDNQRYKCCGNAVTTNVITAIVNEMFGDN